MQLTVSQIWRAAGSWLCIRLELWQTLTRPVARRQFDVLAVFARTFGSSVAIFAGLALNRKLSLFSYFVRHIHAAVQYVWNENEAYEP